MIVRVLGSAAGGGVPQWNCACPNCDDARRGLAPARTQSSIAIGDSRGRWLLFNVSPDVAHQCAVTQALWPASPRGTPIFGFFLTDANIDHVGGLAELRQAGDHAFVVRSTHVVRSILERSAAFSRFTTPPHLWAQFDDGKWLRPVGGDDPVGSTLDVRAVPVPGFTPGYAGRREARGVVVAYVVRDRSSQATVVVAPIFASLEDALRSEIASADVAFVDGSFFDDDELVRCKAMPKRARDLGHLPMSGEDGSLAALSKFQARRIYTHVNNTNPILRAGTQARNAVDAVGAEIAYDGMLIEL